MNHLVLTGLSPTRLDTRNEWRQFLSVREMFSLMIENKGGKLQYWQETIIPGLESPLQSVQVLWEHVTRGSEDPLGLQQRQK